MNLGGYKPIIVNHPAKIINRPHAGIVGLVIAADWIGKTITLRTEEGTEITENWLNIEQ